MLATFPFFSSLLLYCRWGRNRYPTFVSFIASKRASSGSGKNNLSNLYLLLCYIDKKIYTIDEFSSYFFPTDKSTLGQIWTLCNKTCPGQLSVAELFACLSFVGFAQRNPQKNLCLTLIDGFPCVPDLGTIVLGYKDKNHLLLTRERQAAAISQ